MNHVGFGPGNSSLSLAGTLLWSATSHLDPNPLLLRLDPNPVEVLGFLVFDRIGVATTEYHDGDGDDRAIAVSPCEAWDELLVHAPADGVRST